MNDASQIVVLFVYASLFLLLIIVVIVLLAFLARHKTRNFQLKMDEAQRQFEQEMMKIKLELQEEVFAKVSGEIHDHIGQVLSAVALGLQSLDTGTMAERGKHIIDGSVQRIITATEELRNLSHLMNGTKVESLGIIEALQQELSFLRLNKALKISFSYTNRDTFPQLGGGTALLLFRIAQEAIRNALTHSLADQLEVGLNYTPATREVTMNITDNGTGFPAETTGGMGLESMQQRARLLGAVMTISPNEPSGTIILVKLKT